MTIVKAIKILFFVSNVLFAGCVVENIILFVLNEQSIRDNHPTITNFLSEISYSGFLFFWFGGLAATLLGIISLLLFVVAKWKSKAAGVKWYQILLPISYGFVHLAYICVLGLLFGWDQL